MCKFLWGYLVACSANRFLTEINICNDDIAINRNTLCRHVWETKGSTNKWLRFTSSKVYTWQMILIQPDHQMQKEGEAMDVNIPNLIGKSVPSEHSICKVAN